ncbi:Aste57867_20080 [Aphanomyces stellatus]|uniref:Aste57867_20080 protein n=1 Tax=Aphanomyces stellatus TaxID=120398 RepID=A0A485LFN2_9STRA|nr:hypothetical protein As57867_020014 [Aphanomyces stellatus]VFT96775.1 Aste57867_20080 [Aphanomyces stellatus]
MPPFLDRGIFMRPLVFIAALAALAMADTPTDVDTDAMDATMSAKFVLANESDPVVNKTAEAFATEYAAFLSDVFAVVSEKTILQTLVYQHPLLLNAAAAKDDDEADDDDPIYVDGVTYKLDVLFKLNWDSTSFRKTPYVTVARCIYDCVTDPYTGDIECEGKSFREYDRHEVALSPAKAKAATAFINRYLHHTYDNVEWQLTAYETQDGKANAGDLVEYFQFQVDQEPVKCEAVIYSNQTTAPPTRKMLYFDDACLKAQYHGLSLSEFERRQRVDVAVLMAGLLVAAAGISVIVAFRNRIFASKHAYRNLHVRLGRGTHDTGLLHMRAPPLGSILSAMKGSSSDHGAASHSSHTQENYFDGPPTSHDAPFKSVQSPHVHAAGSKSAHGLQPSFRGAVGEKIHLDLSLQWANNFGIQLGMFLFFLGALAVAIVIPSLPGHSKIEVGLLAGGSVTILSTAAVLYTYWAMPSWKKHPNPLIFYRSLFDMGFVLVLMTTQLYKCFNDACTAEDTKSATDSQTLEILGVQGCNAIAGLTQFFLLGSECWFFVMTIDLYKSVRSPFTDFKHNVRTYHMFVWGVSLLTAILLVALKLSGPSEFNYCWSAPHHKQQAAPTTAPPSAFDATSAANTTSKSIFWSLNVTSWGFFYAWIILYFFCAIGVIYFAWQRLKGGLAETLRVRLRVLHSVTVYVVAIIIYWAITFGVYVPYLALGLVNNPTDYRALSQVMVFFITCKGYFDFFVWFQINELPSGKSPVTAAPPPSSDKAAKKMDVDVDLSPQVNQALRAEVLYYTTSGIMQAARLSDAMAFDAPMQELRLTPPGAAITADSPTTLFVDQRPGVFARIRQFYGVSTDMYIKSLTKTTKERLSEGASGAFMFFSEDQQLIVKSMSEGEASFLQSIASDYHDFLVSNPESLLTRFFGCHSVHLYGTTFHFVVMSNLFSDQTKIIHRRYDIKGSWVNRSAKQPTKGKKVTCRHCNGKYVFGSVDGNVCPLRVGTHEPNVILKDNDLTQKVRLTPQVAEELYDQIQKDAGFLCNHGIMDYSLLMGVHNVEYRVSKDMDLSGHVGGTTNLDNSLLLNSNITSVKPIQPTVRDTSIIQDDVLEDRLPNEFSGTRRRSTTVASNNKNGTRQANTVVGPSCYYFGIIDILQLWNFDKKLERNTKILLLRKDPEGLSAVPPTKYKDRFCSKMADILRIGVHDETYQTINMWEEAGDHPQPVAVHGHAAPADASTHRPPVDSKRLYL